MHSFRLLVLGHFQLTSDPTDRDLFRSSPVTEEQRRTSRPVSVRLGCKHAGVGLLLTAISGFVLTLRTPILVELTGLHLLLNLCFRQTNIIWLFQV